MTDFGIVDFLLLEPARVAAAAPKCFYHQTDHWTGSIVQGTEPTLWHWDGRYFFDKARGMGGVRIDNFAIGGQPADPRLIPGFPAQFSPYFTGTGGGAFLNQTIARRSELRGPRGHARRRSRRSTATAGGTRIRLFRPPFGNE